MPRLYSFVTTALAVALAVSAQHAPGRAPRRFGRASKLTASRSPLGASVALPSTVNCTWSNFTQDVDHFARGAQSATFDQRICTYSGFMKDGADARPDLVLFYTGNESPVDEYINNTGLMWEAPGALGLSNVLLVFAEHRFEGESLLPTVGMENCMAYGTVEQALADYATIISSLQAGFPESKAGSKAAAKVPVVAVGGSYGGMLASWLRMKYPSAVVGAIAGSAPIWGFPLTDVPLDSSAVATTRSFTTVGGAGSDRCADNLLSAWSLMDVIGTTDEGREFLQDAFKLCSPLNDHAAVKELIQGVSGVFFDLAEANYPFESTYITSAVGPGYYPLPAWPLRVACANGLESDHEVTIDGDKTSVSYTVNAAAVDSDGAEGVTVSVEWDSAKGAKTYTLEEIESTHIPALFDGVREAWAVWCNVTGELQCFGTSSCTTGASGHTPISPRPSESADSEAAEAAEALQRTLVANDGEAVGDNVCTATIKGSWGPVCCNDDLYLANYLAQGTGNDMYWPPNQEQGYSMESVLGPKDELQAGCDAGAGLYGYPEKSDLWAHWLDTFFGGKSMDSVSNIIFSNGLLDPWSGAGVYADGQAPYPDLAYEGPTVQNITASGVQALILDLGAHHLDLMFMDDNDPECAYEARDAELAAIKAWAGI